MKNGKSLVRKQHCVLPVKVRKKPHSHYNHICALGASVPETKSKNSVGVLLNGCHCGDKQRK